MGSGAFVSALLHGSVIALALIAWPKLMPPIELQDHVVPVDILPPSEETNVAPQVQAEKPVETPPPEPTPPPPQPAPSAAAEAPPPPPPPDDVAPLPLPDTPPPPVIPKPQPPPPPSQRFADAHPRAKPKPEKAKPSFDALLDKLAKDSTKTEQKPVTPVKPAPSARTVTGAGAQTAMTESEIDALRSQMMKCWNVPIGAPDPRALVLRVKVDLNQDGTVSGAPQLLDTQGLSDPYFRAASESAIRAVKMCAPYKLPTEKYDAWNEVTVTFDPTKMAGF
jgi:hypothetical protein